MMLPPAIPITAFTLPLSTIPWFWKEYFGYDVIAHQAAIANYWHDVYKPFMPKTITPKQKQGV